MTYDKTRKNVAVDFDGVIHEYLTPWQAPDIIPDKPVDGVIDWLNAVDEHYNIVVYSTRAAALEGRLAIAAYLAEHGFDIELEQVVPYKPMAVIYLDDRGWRFEGPGSFPTVEQINQARPWNRLPASL